MSVGADTTALGVVELTPGSDVGRLGADAAAAEAAAAAAKVVEPEKTAEAVKPAEPEKSPEQVSRDAALVAAEKAVTDAKTPEEKAAAEAKLAELKGEKKDGAPEKYEDFKLPDGVALDKASLDQVLPVFKELGLSQEQAQKLVDIEAARVAARANDSLKAWNTHMETTLSAAKADKDVGGQNWDQSIGHAKVFIDKFGTPALQAYLNQAEAGSHVEIIRAFARAGKAVSEDGFVPGAAKASGAPKSQAERLFPNHKP